MTRVVRLHESKLYQSLKKINDRYFDKFREAAGKNQTQQVAAPDLVELIGLWEDHYDKMLQNLLFHGYYVTAVKVMVEDLDANYIGMTGRTLTVEQFEALKRMVKALKALNGVYTNLSKEKVADMDFNDIYKFIAQ